MDQKEFLAQLDQARIVEAISPDVACSAARIASTMRAWSSCARNSF